jgi:hypothetical protein
MPLPTGTAGPKKVFKLLLFSTNSESMFEPAGASTSSFFWHPSIKKRTATARKNNKKRTNFFMASFILRINDLKVR